MPKPDCVKCGDPEIRHKAHPWIVQGFPHRRIYCFTILPDTTACDCDGYEPMMEDCDGPDSPASGDRRGAAVPVGDAQGRAPVTTIQDVDRAWDALTEACDRYTAQRGARA